MPFADYKDFSDCLQKNKGKDDPEAYCAEIKRKTEKLVDWNYHLSFTKIAEIDDTMYIAGEASNPDEDEDGELMDMESLKGAFDGYMANPVIKFMHDKAPQWRGAIGVVVQKYTDSGGTVWKTSFGSRPFLVAKFVKGTMPGWMWKGIQEGNYKGFSIGGKALKKVAGRVYVKSWLETSVVDIPSAHGAFFSVLKMACSGEDCALEKIKTPINSEKDPAAVEPYKETEEDKKRSSWYNMSEIIRFKEDFPQALLKDIQERFGWEEKYIKELLEKIDSVSDKYTQKDTQIDSFSKGGAGSGVKGHKTVKETQSKLKAKRDKLVDEIDILRKKYDEVDTERREYWDKYFGEHPLSDPKSYGSNDPKDKEKVVTLGEERKKIEQVLDKKWEEYKTIDKELSDSVDKEKSKQKKQAKKDKKKKDKQTKVNSFVKTINDYILDSFLKGGPGSGIKGHRTAIDIHARKIELKSKKGDKGEVIRYLSTLSDKELSGVLSKVKKNREVSNWVTGEIKAREEEKRKEKTELWNRVMGAAAQKKEMDAGIIRRGRITDKNKGD